ncbi:hypothetical protein [Acinetobacter rudis]|uniref:Excinuclease ATPase subunit n=1 Tax=Acinetobacter rudis CIP 110305 TaxID=421052 RepID=S3NTI9_9GAMM|nr:hypothetical protein [Acinetobacter rudis]EPF70006.1 hypothetical protein F945_03570 [Acinetobacter rudis CIP 110305]
MSMKKITLALALGLGTMLSAHAADKAYDYDFKSAVDRAVADGFLDGSVKFYLAGTHTGGKLLKPGVVTNKKTNGFAKSAEGSCDHVLRSNLIQLQESAKAQGANAVTNIVSYFKANESKSTTTYQCFKGTAITSVALKGDLVKF